jgi:hypothetical protein
MTARLGRALAFVLIGAGLLWIAIVTYFLVTLSFAFGLGLGIDVPIWFAGVVLYFFVCGWALPLGVGFSLLIKKCRY